MLSALISVVLAGVAAQAAPERSLASIVDSHARGGFSGTVVVDVRGRIELARAAGHADRRRRLRNTPTTVFDVGSFAKDYTAAAVMRLVQQRRLALDDPLTELLPSVPSDKAGITVAQLLGHRSGLRKLHFLHDFEPLGRDEAVARILARPLRFRPGAGEFYSDSGYTLLAAIVERVSGSRFPEFVRREVFARARLRTAGFYGHDWTGRVAVGYGAWRYGAVNSPAAWSGPSWALMGSGGVAMNAFDLIRFQRALRAGRVLAPASLRALELAVYGVSKPPPVVALGGATAYGFNAVLVEFVRADALIAIASNAGSPRKLPAEALERDLVPVLARRLGVKLPRRP